MKKFNIILLIVLYFYVNIAYASDGTITLGDDVGEMNVDVAIHKIYQAAGAYSCPEHESVTCDGASKDLEIGAGTTDITYDCFGEPADYSHYYFGLVEYNLSTLPSNIFSIDDIRFVANTSYRTTTPPELFIYQLNRTPYKQIGCNFDLVNLVEGDLFIGASPYGYTRRYLSESNSFNDNNGWHNESLYGRARTDLLNYTKNQYPFGLGLSFFSTGDNQYLNLSSNESVLAKPQLQIDYTTYGTNRQVKTIQSTYSVGIGSPFGTGIYSYVLGGGSGCANSTTQDNNSFGSEVFTIINPLTTYGRTLIDFDVSSLSADSNITSIILSIAKKRQLNHSYFGASEFQLQLEGTEVWAVNKTAKNMQCLQTFLWDYQNSEMWNETTKTGVYSKRNSIINEGNFDIYSNISLGMSAVKNLTQDINTTTGDGVFTIALKLISDGGASGTDGSANWLDIYNPNSAYPPLLYVLLTPDECSYNGTGNWVINKTCQFNNYNTTIIGNLTIGEQGFANMTRSNFNFSGVNRYINIKKGGQIQMRTKSGFQTITR